MSDTSTSTRTHVEAAVERVTSTTFIFSVLAMASALLLIGPWEVMKRLAVVSRDVLHAVGAGWLPRLL